MEDEQAVKVNQDFLVTETIVDPKLPLETVDKWMRQRKTTGRLCVDYSQGGLQKVSLVEKTKAKDGIRATVRKLFGV
jgi:hypothetical protein